MSTNNSVPLAKKNNVFAISIKVVTIMTLLFAFLSFQKTSAQTVPTISESKLVCDISKRNPCTSKDLEVLDVYVEGVDECYTCVSGETVTRKLYMTIVNKTGSVRTSFALYGTLNNATLNGISGKVFICVGSIDPKDTATFEAGTITFTCGSTVTLTDNFLAWTDAAGTTADRCNTFSNATKCSDIAPKCGTSAIITIRTPLAAAAATVTKPCENATTGGSISVTPSGGLAPYDIVISRKPSGACPTTAPSSSDANFVTSWTNVTGTQTTSETDMFGDTTYCIYVTDANGCTKNFSYAIEDKPCCVTPAKPTVCEVPQSNLCPASGGVTIKVSNLQANAYYTVTQGTSPNFTYNQTQQATGGATELTFTGLATGAGLTVYGEDRTSTPYCKSAEATCADITICATSTSSVNNTQIQSTDMAPLGQPKVIAAPNPFNDRIRFTLESDVAGQGTLELYNLQGQKVKTVYQGYVEKGQRQNIEYSVPVSQRSALIYMFRVGNQKASGKLLGIKQ